MVQLRLTSSGGDELKVPAVQVDQATNDVNLLHGDVNGINVLRAAGHVGRPELREAVAMLELRTTRTQNRNP